MTTSDVELSFASGGGGGTLGASPRLILDLLSDRREGEVPSMILADGQRVRGEAVEGAEERFAFALSARALDSNRVVIAIPFVSGDVEIVLP